MTGITDAGEAHMQELAERHRQRIAQARADQLQADLENLGIGRSVWERQPDDAQHPPRGGLIVEYHPEPRDADPYLIVADIGHTNIPGTVTKWEARIRLLKVADIGQVTLLSAHTKIAQVRDLFACIGSRSGLWGRADDELLGWAVALKQDVERGGR